MRNVSLRIRKNKRCSEGFDFFDGLKKVRIFWKNLPKFAQALFFSLRTRVFKVIVPGIYLARNVSLCNRKNKRCSGGFDFFNGLKKSSKIFEFFAQTCEDVVYLSAGSSIQIDCAEHSFGA